jgi:predicted  nucleic acid-binding Zn-ribbon protein
MAKGRPLKDGVCPIDQLSKASSETIDQLSKASSETKDLLRECHAVLRDMRAEKRELVRERQAIRRMTDEISQDLCGSIDEMRTAIAQTLRDQAAEFYDRAMKEYRSSLGINGFMPEPGTHRLPLVR